MKTTIELPEEVIQRAKIAAIQRKTTLKDLICQSLIREIESPQAGSTDAESQRKKRASALLDSLDAIQIVTRSTEGGIKCWGKMNGRNNRKRGHAVRCFKRGSQKWIG